MTFGQAVVGETGRTAESYLPELEASLQDKGRLSVADFASELSSFYSKQWQSAVDAGYSGPGMVFFIGGYDADAPYGRVFRLVLPGEPTAVELHADSFGASWGGQTSIVDRIYKGVDKDLPDELASSLGLDGPARAKMDETLLRRQLHIPVQVMALQDCVDLAVTLIKTTIRMQQLAVELRGVGGPIDVATITRTAGLQTVQFKEVKVGD